MTKEPKKPEVKQEPKKTFICPRCSTPVEASPGGVHFCEFPDTGISPMVYGLLGLIIILLVSGTYFVLSNVSKTNRLLSTFQRIDTVKDGYQSYDVGRGICDVYDCSQLLQSACTEGFVLADGKCIKTIGKEKEKNSCKKDSNCHAFAQDLGKECPPHYEENVDCSQGDKCILTCVNFSRDGDQQNDPNLCKTWKTICKDGPIGPQCDVVCSIGEGVE